MRKPTNTRVTCDAACHGYEATDYSFQPDEWVYSPEDGRVTDVTLSAGACGKRVIITAGNVQYYMCHFQDVAVKLNDPVKEGQKIGIMGHTGLPAENGRHLHLVILENGNRVPDPDKWLNSKIGTGEKMGKITQAEVGKAYKLDGRTASAADKLLHSTKGTVTTVLDGLIRDSASKGNLKRIADLKTTITSQTKSITSLKAEVTALKAVVAEKDKRIAELEAGSTDQFEPVGELYVKKG